MTYQIAIMYGVSVLFAAVGAGLLLSLLQPSGPAKVYVFRMVGIMAIALGVVLFASASAMWQWSVEP